MSKANHTKHFTKHRCSRIYFTGKSRFILYSIVLMILLLVLFILIPRHNILHTDFDMRMQGASLSHIFGTDHLGRDLYSLMLAGGGRTLLVVGLSTAISFTLGSLLGTLGGYFGRWLENLVSILADFFLVLPTFILAMVLSSIFGFSPFMAGILFGIGNMGDYINQSLNLTKNLKHQEFIDAERVIGLSHFKLIALHIFPNICGQLIVFMGNQASSVVVQYSGLAFIGLGTDITIPDWGSLLYQYRSFLISHPHLVLIPAGAIFCLSLFFHLVFDRKLNRR